MSANIYFNHILMEDYKQERLQTFMLALLLYVICSLDLLYRKVVANIQC